MTPKTEAHTPGPWNVSSAVTRNHDSIIEAAPRDANDPRDMETIAYALDFNAYDRDGEREANARLIAASPALLEAAKDALTAFQSGRNGSAAMVLLASAIARAEGR